MAKLTLNYDHLLNVLSRTWHNKLLVSVYAENVAPPGEPARYQPVTAVGEGDYCVDDVARATILLLRSHRPEFLLQAYAGLRFLLGMQANDGTFYNFATVQKGRLKINRTGETSHRGMSWWTARAFHALAESYAMAKWPHVVSHGVGLEQQVFAALVRVIPVIEACGARYEGIGGRSRWLINDATDLTGVVVQGLLSLLRSNLDWRLGDFVAKFCFGIVAHQVSGVVPDHGRFHNDVKNPDGSRHLWGSRQVETLALAARACVDLPAGASWLTPTAGARWLAAAELCADHYWSRGPRAILAEGESEIAYGIGSVISGFAELYHTTHKRKYATAAKQWGGWFFGRNGARSIMYDAESGRCFDGIEYPKVGQARVNTNSGAESTIEALLALQTLAGL